MLVLISGYGTCVLLLCCCFYLHPVLCQQQSLIDVTPHSTVRIVNQYGVTITSAMMVMATEPSEHFRYILNEWIPTSRKKLKQQKQQQQLRQYQYQHEQKQQATRNDPNFAFHNFSFPEQACSLELLGFTNVQGLDNKQGKFSIRFPLRADGLGLQGDGSQRESEEFWQAHVNFSLPVALPLPIAFNASSHIQDGGKKIESVKLRCYCQQIQGQYHHHLHDQLNGHEIAGGADNAVGDHSNSVGGVGGRVALHGAIVYFCPVPVTKADLCHRINRRQALSSKAKKWKNISESLAAAQLHVSLVTAYINTDGHNITTRQLLHNSFIMNALPPLPLIRTGQNKNTDPNMDINTESDTNNSSGASASASAGAGGKSYSAEMPPDMAVCSVVNYDSSVSTQQAAMRAVAREWLQHYLSLHMRVMLFDLTGQLGQLGQQHQYDIVTPVKDTNVNTVSSTSTTDVGRFDYYNYTIFGQLGHLSANMKHDPSWNHRHNAHNRNLGWMLDSDKMATLTHCRFEARALHGLLKVLVVDIDEFLLCDPEYSTHIRAVAAKAARTAKDARTARAAAPTVAATSGVGTKLRAISATKMSSASTFAAATAAPGFMSGYSVQRALIRDLVSQKGIGDNDHSVSTDRSSNVIGEISLSQNVPFQVTPGHIRDCIGNATNSVHNIVRSHDYHNPNNTNSSSNSRTTTHSHNSIFNCISSKKYVARRSSKLKKNIHTRLMCPWTNFHNACQYHQAPGSVYACSCPLTFIEDIPYYGPQAQTPVRQGQAGQSHGQGIGSSSSSTVTSSGGGHKGSACDIIHFEFKQVNKYKTDVRLPVSELAVLSQSIM